MKVSIVPAFKQVVSQFFKLEKEHPVGNSDHSDEAADCARSRLRIMKHVYRSPLTILCTRCRTKAFSSRVHNTCCPCTADSPPRQSYCRASIRACSISGLSDFGRSVRQSRRAPTRPRTRFSISGSFAASFGGTWISEPNVLAFSNNVDQVQRCRPGKCPFSANASC